METEVIIKWVPEDIETLRPNWSLEQCEDALEGIRRTLTDRSIEFGWEVIEAALEFDGYDN